MTYARLDDGLDGHPKVRKAGWEAFGVWCAAIVHSSAKLLDGHIDAEWFEERLPNRRKRDDVLARLVEQRMLEPNGDGYIIHDYHDHNPSRQEVVERRDRAAKKKAGQRSMSPGDNHGDS